MTKEDFIAGYCERSKISWEELSKWRVAVPCNCGEEKCDGWAMINPEFIEDHERMYAIRQTESPTKEK